MPILRWDLFCRVIDNHGDLGVCWRLARQLAACGQLVRLWVDDPAAVPEGSRTHVIVPRDALLMFPTT